MGLGLTNFALEGGVSGRTSLKIEGKGNSEMTLLSAYITLKMQLPCPLASISSPLSLYVDPLPAALGFL